MVLAAAGIDPAAAQVHPQDGIDRNLQERAAQEHEFHVGLQEDIPPVPRPIPISSGKSGASGTSGLQISIPSPGSEILRRDQAPPPAAPARVTTGKSVVSSDLQLQDSQSRRQMELQTQIENRPEPERQQILQIQQLQFDRENSANDLGTKIMRDSSRALGTPR